MKFEYLGINQEGDEVGGSIDADDRLAAIHRLEYQGITPTSIQTGKSTRQDGRRVRGKPAQREVLLVMRELSTLLRSGVPIAEAVGSLANSSHHPAICQAFEGISRHIRQGGNFADALAQAELRLPWYFHQLTQAGELTGKLAESLADGAKQMEYDQQVASDLRSALVYPSILVVSGIAAIVIVFMAVVPNFAGMIGDNPEDVHWLGRAVIATGIWFNEHRLLIGLGALVSIVAAVSMLRTQAARQALIELLARMPLIGQWILESETGRWASTLSTLLSNRVELTRAMELSRDGMQLKFLRSRLTEVLKSVRGGSTLADALSDYGAITPTGVDLVRVGERSGALPEMLRSLGELYDVMSRDRMQRTLQLIEPMAILIIGSAIGIIITGVILAVMGAQEAGL